MRSIIALPQSIEVIYVWVARDNQTAMIHKQIAVIVWQEISDARHPVCWRKPVDVKVGGRIFITKDM